MSDLYLTNSLTRKKEKFESITPGMVGMYTCGPTVYDYQHIGNLRTMILSDVLHRVLKFNGYEVEAVRNITDIDDKIIKNASKKNEPIDKYTEKYTEIFFEDLGKLNILPVKENPKATEYVEEMISYVKDLIEKGLAYTEKDGSVYFDISEFPNYGKLSGLNKENLKTGTRTLSDEYTKDNVQDFALWKSTKPGEVASYDSPWGKGRPGWHIECSVMSQKHLGDTFDIHVGGKDLLFPHHENEVAQSEGKTSKPFVNFWVHGDMLLVDGGKMSKSLKNFYLLKDLEKKGIDPLGYRYLVLTAHYRDNLNFTWESLKAASVALEKLRNKTAELKTGQRKSLSEEKDSKRKEYSERFKDSLNDDLNTPRALAVVWEALKSNIPNEDKYDLLILFDEVLGLGLSEVKTVDVPEKINKLVKKRKTLRDEGKFDESDKVREEISDLGYKIKDTGDGTIVEPKK